MIQPTIDNLLCRAEGDVIGTQYCFDYTEGVQILLGLLRRNIRVRLLLDKSQVVSPSSSRQKERVKALLDWDAEVRGVRPDNNAKYGIMHAKTWLIDGEIYIGGSSNFTNNSLTNSIEQCIVLRQDHVTATHIEWFEGLWARATDYAQILAEDAAEETKLRVL